MCENLRETTVGELVNKAKDIIKADPGMTVLEAAKLMAAKNVGILPVIGEDGKLLGMLSERDIVHRVVALEKEPSESVVVDAMTPDPVSVKPSTTLEDALCLMSQLRVRHLLVVDDAGKPLGIVSIRDIMKCKTY
ncbi:MAG: CBS domain-containing protein [Desulfurococcales archaeon]|nr:CBS domain-containing protein [Desulfurococcales archaeon]